MGAPGDTTKPPSAIRRGASSSVRWYAGRLAQPPKTDSFPAFSASR